MAHTPHGKGVSAVVAVKALQTQLVNIPMEAVASISGSGLPSTTWLENNPSQVSVCLTAGSRTFYFGWSGLYSAPVLGTHPKDAKSSLLTVEIDASVVASLGLREGDKSQITILTNAPVASAVNVEPLSSDDWEILELHAEILEVEFLKQCRVVYPGQPILIWVRRQTLIRLRVVEISPSDAPFLRLDNNSEVIVAPKDRASAAPAAATAESNELDVHGSIQKRGISARVIRLENVVSHSNKPAAQFEHTCFLGVANPAAPLSHQQMMMPPKPLINHQPAPLKLNSLKSLHSSKVIKYMRIVCWKTNPMSQDSTNSESTAPTKRDPTSFGASAFHIAVVETDLIAAGHLAMSRSMRELVNVEAYSRVRLMDARQDPLSQFKIILKKAGDGATPQSIVLNSQAEQEESTLPTLFLQYLQQLLVSPWNRKIVLSSNTVLDITPNTAEQSGQDGKSESRRKRLQVVLQIVPENEEKVDTVRSPWSWVTVLPEDIESLNVVEVAKASEGDESAIRLPFADRQDFSCPALGGVSKYFKTACTHIASRLAMRGLKEKIAAPSLGGILIHSNRGMGKTKLAESILHSFSHNLETLTYSHILQCGSLKGKKVAHIREALNHAFTVCMFQSPSILLLDDLDLICPSNAENADGLASKQITLYIISLMRQFCIQPVCPGAVTVVATAVDKSAINPLFLSSHAIADIVHLSAPGRLERSEILQVLLKNAASSPETEIFNVMSIASKTEGYRPLDLETLVSRAGHARAVRQIKESTKNVGSAGEGILLKDLESALEGFVPPALKGLKVEDSEAVGWADIGGLHEPKKMLIETLEWPTKYAAIFASCPLRLRSGILLYGFPGCGKTILAAAVAKECGLNFISVKGPEILNKYIGESEKSVRDLFDRAQAAKPCILFFDEFDSIAPRRGNDNTGVTDRVVNQLLTQMDGAEGLDGVYVLAATSRPDLIDPALLRPGRLDKSVLCDMPSTQERAEILEAVSRKLTLSPELDLKKYSGACEHFTGADLQGLIYSAQLEAIHEQIDEPLASTATTSSETKSPIIKEEEEVGHESSAEALGKKKKKKNKGKEIASQQNGTAKPDVKDDTSQLPTETHKSASVEEVFEFALVQSGLGDEGTVLSGAERTRIRQRIQTIRDNHKLLEKATKTDSGQTGNSKKPIVSSSAVVIEARHFEAALASTRGSLTAQERRRFELIFSEFAGTDDAVEKMNRVGKKCSMA
ncbi:Peroxisome biosynthesis protein pex1 [Chytriomyces hyalinus]|nr:Peroxisome biosynthesis protein pex1 [Chytriomyces hyalinus]